MIGVDWGTSGFRAYRLTPGGEIRDRRAGARGIMAVADGRFAETLREEIGPWLAAGEERVLLSGMIGSRQGWVEAPYLPCPAGVDELAARLVDVPFDWARVKLVPGLIGADATGVAEVMRGEETQIAGIVAAIGGDGLVCLPGTHAKWVRIAEGRVAAFSTHMTGEVFAALRGHTILGRTMAPPGRDGAHDAAAFAAGLARAGQAGGVLHHLFGVRSLNLTGALAEAAGASYLSGLLIGHEVRAALAEARDAVVHLVGATELAGLYETAIRAGGRDVRRHAEDAAAAGLHMIGFRADWR